MKKLPAMTDMACKPSEMEVAVIAPPAADEPYYPYGLRITLTEEELDKLDLDSDCEVGDMIHIHCLAKVCGINTNSTVVSSSKTIQLQITHIACEDEEHENEEYEAEEEKSAPVLGKKNPYKK